MAIEVANMENLNRTQTLIKTEISLQQRAAQRRKTNVSAFFLLVATAIRLIRKLIK